MNKVHFLPVIFLSLFLTIVLTTPAIGGEVVNSDSGRYYVSVPQSSAPMPVLVFLHGMGNDHDQGRRIFDNYTNQANIVLVSPEGGSQNKSWMMGSGPSVKKRVEEVLAKNDNADKDNIFLVGYSAGGGVAYSFGPADSSFYAGMAVINAPYQPGSISLQGKLPVYLVECEGDPNKPGAEMAKRDLESAEFDVKYDIIPSSQGGSGHAYPTATASPMIIKWIKDSAKSTGNDDDNNDDDDNDSDNDNDNDNDDDNDNDTDDDNDNNDDDDNDSDNDDNDNDDDDDNDNDDSNSDDDDNDRDDNDDSKNDKNEKDNEKDKKNSKSSEPKEKPVVNSFGIPVGGLTDSEINTLVKEWLNNVFKPSQSPPNNEKAWSLNDWGIWTCGNISHTGKIDGYGSITDFWLKTNPDCFSFAENRGSEMHIPESSVEDVNDSKADEQEKNQNKDKSGNNDDSGPVSESNERPDDSDEKNSDKDADSDNNTNDSNSTNNNDNNNNDSSNNNDNSANQEPTITVSDDNGTSSENVPDLGSGEDSGSNGTNTAEKVNGRAVNLYVPSKIKTDNDGQWGLVVALAGTAGNTEYLKMKLKQGCDDNQCVFAGLAAKNSGGQYGFRWEKDESENIQFIKDVIKTLENEYDLSTSRTYLVGFSNGGFFTGRIGSTVDGEIEGFIMCEGAEIISTSDKQIVISGGGQTSFDSDNSGKIWKALCPNMGHRFPGVAYGDSGVQTDSAGHTINGTTMIKWLEE